MNLDIRFPMGLLFTILGVLVLVYGMITPPTAYAAHHHLGVNINIVCGAIFGAFGVAMLLLAKLAKGKK